MPHPEHSPGPFRVVPWHSWYEIRDADDRIVCDTLTAEDRTREAANLALFSAAPEMLEACETALDLTYGIAWSIGVALRDLDDDQLGTLVHMPWFRARALCRRVLDLRRIIAKARGVVEGSR